MTTRTEFEAAAEKLLGSDRFQQCQNIGFSTHDLCREIAQEHLVECLASEDANSLQLVKAIASRLWKGDGITGFTD